MLLAIFLPRRTLTVPGVTDGQRVEGQPSICCRRARNLMLISPVCHLIRRSQMYGPELLPATSHRRCSTIPLPLSIRMVLILLAVVLPILSADLAFTLAPTVRMRSSGGRHQTPAFTRYKVLSQGWTTAGRLGQRPM